MRATRRARLAALVVGALAVPTGLVVSTAGTASAATPTCNNAKVYYGGYVPYYSGTGTVDCNMVQGTNSQGVWALQHSMNLCYHENLVLDGDFGPATKAALIRTQQKAGTYADGVYGPNTRKAMYHVGDNYTCVRVP